jgi:hypothetical protein
MEKGEDWAVKICDEGGKYCFGDWDKGCHHDDEVERYDEKDDAA